MNEIVKFKPDQTLEEFKKQFFDEETLSLFQEYRSIASRVYHHILSRIDITGTIDFVNKENERFELDYFKNKVVLGIFELLKGHDELNRKYKDLESRMLKNEIPILLNQYYDKVFTTVNNDKIYYLRNIVCNGFYNSKLNIEEKILFLNLVHELTYDQINILAILYEYKVNPEAILEKLSLGSKPDYITVEMISKLLNKNTDSIRILTSNLIGKGLVMKISRYADIDSIENDSNLGIEEFVKVFIEEIKEIHL